MAKKNDFNQDLYIEKVDLAHDHLKGLDARIKDIEKITEPGLILKTLRKDNELRTELSTLIWQTIKDKAMVAFLSLLAAVFILPVLSKVFNIVMSKIGLPLN